MHRVQKSAFNSPMLVAKPPHMLLGFKEELVTAHPIPLLQTKMVGPITVSRSLTCVLSILFIFSTPVLGPSDLSFSETYPCPRAMSEEDMDDVVRAFVFAVERCKSAGFDFIEIHAAHGYLLHSFVSPLSNVRDDQYGGQPLENRLRFPLRVVEACRRAWGKPLWVRISACDWAEGPEQDESGTWKQWGIEQSKIFVGEMKKLGVDLIDASSGGNWVNQSIPLKHGYQVHFAEALKQAHPSLVISTVGLITDPLEANSYIESGKADVISLARELLRTPHWPLHAAKELGVTVKAANQYERAWQ
ncbi:hypothetical protein H2248_001116 [Termitomyces sp. 'cryptogamus']|nr:hypothetical protein H2248_001116 [Termitomyces sp. 'cryptogamus']